MRGNITRRGRSSWRIKYDVPAAATSKRATRYLTVRGSRRDANRELARLITAAHDGTLVEPSKTTVADYLRSWLAGLHGLAGKTRQEYGRLTQLVIPHLGNHELQRLRPAHIADWHAKLLASGGKNGRPLSARTVAHAHHVLHTALERAVGTELLARNVAHAVSPPKVAPTEIAALKADEIAPVLAALKGHRLEPLAVLTLSAGARRGEILALRWGDVDLAAGTVRIARSLEQTVADGLKFKSPKTARGVRTISLPAVAVETLQAHRKRQLEQRIALGQGRPDADTLVFSTLDGDPMGPNGLSRDWGDFIRERRLPNVTFHGLRHSHVSAQIASGVDPLTISRRIGHANVSTTMNVYGHLFKQTDTTAAKAIEAALKGAER
jgi:integrase